MQKERKGIRKNIKNIKKNLGRAALIGFLAMPAAACGGPSGETVTKVQTMYAELVEQHNEVVEAYAEIEDDSLEKELDELAEKIDGIGNRDTQGMTEKELDALVEEMDQYAGTYEEMLVSIQETAKSEAGAEVYAIPVTLQNNTGVDLYQVYLYEKDSADKGKNLIREGEHLDGLGSLNLLNLYVTEGKEGWYLETVDEEGHTIEAADINFKGREKDTVIIRMEYSFDEMAGWVELP